MERKKHCAYYKLLQKLKKEEFKTESKSLVNEIKRHIISLMINDLIEETKKNILINKPQSAYDVRNMKSPLVIFSKKMNDNIIEIRRFLMTKMYKHWKINIMNWVLCIILIEVCGGIIIDTFSNLREEEEEK